MAIASLFASTLPVAAQAVTPPPPPRIDSVRPAVVKPGEEIRIRGAAFIDVRTVSIAGLSVPYRVRNKKQIVATAPPHAARGTVVVATGGGVATSPRFVVVRPTIQVLPNEGSVGSVVDVSGTGFVPGEPVDVSLGRVALVTTSADSGGAIATSFVVPARTVPGPTLVYAQGRFSGVPSQRRHLITASWPQRGLTSSGNRRIQDTYLGAAASPSLVLDWSADTLTSTRSSPAVTGGLVIAGADTGALLVVPRDCASGGESCAPVAIGTTRGAVSSPAVSGPIAYVGSEDGSLYAFDLTCDATGGPCDPVWSYGTGDAITSSPAVDDEVVVVGSTDGRVYAFDTACSTDTTDGADVEVDRECWPRWVAETGGAIHSSPAIHDGVVYIGSNDGYLHAFETDCASGGGTCQPLWRGWTGGAIRSSPAVANGMVFVGSADSKVHGFAVGCGHDGEVCQAIWRGDADGPVESSPVVADGYVVAGTDAGSVMAFPIACADRDTGCAPVWVAATGGPVLSSPAVTGSDAPGGPMVFIGSDDGFLYAYLLKCRPAASPGLCAAVWASGTSAPITASPAIVDGAVYVTSEDGTIRRWSLP